MLTWNVLIALIFSMDPSVQGLRRVRLRCPDTVGTSALSSDGSTAAWGLADGTIFVRLGEGEPFLLAHKPPGAVMALSISGNNKLLASSSGSGEVCLWDLKRKKQLWTIQPHDRFALSLAMSPDHKVLATGGGDGIIHLWETHDGRKIRTLTDHSETKSKRARRIHSLAFSPNGENLASGSNDFTARIWNLADGRPCFVFQAKDQVNCVRFSSDGKSLVVVAGYREPPIRVFETVTGKERVTIDHRKGETPEGQLMVAFADGNHVVATASSRITFVDLSTKTTLLRTEQRKGAILSLEVSADGKRLLFSCGERAEVKGQLVKLEDYVEFWEIRKPLSRKPAQVTLTEENFKDAWGRLTGADAMKAYQSIYQLVKAANTFDFMKPNVTEIAKATLTQARLEKIIVDLASEQFTIRKAGAKELANLGSEARPYVRRALESNSSLDAKQLLKAFLDKKTAPSSEYVALQRTLEVLENRNDLDSITLLRAISQSKEGIAADEATAVLDRLGRKAKQR